jgi:protein TonB
MSSLRASLPGQTARRWLARIFSPPAMESVFDPFLADLQADWLHAKSTRSAFYTRWSLLRAYLSLAVQVAAFAIGSLLGASYELAPAASSAALHVEPGRPASRTFRYATPLIVAALMTFGLFALMSALIASPPGAVTVDPPTPVTLIRRIQPPDPIVPPKPELPAIPEPKPNMPGMGVQTTETAHHPPVLHPEPSDHWFGRIEPGFVDPIGPATGADHGESPIIRVEPIYPQRALERGIEGWVDVEFTVTAAGTISEPRILRSSPSAIFNGAALRAIKRWKYAPKIVDGQPVARPGMRTRFRFELSASRS